MRWSRPDVQAGVVVLALAAWHGIAGALVGLGDAEALYYCYGRHLAGGYLDHPPMIGWLIAAATRVLGVSPGAVRMVPTICHALTLAGAFVLARDGFGSGRAGLVAVLALALVPMVTVGGLAAAPDAPASALWVWSVVVFAAALRRHRRGHAPTRGRGWIEAGLVGAMFGLTFVAKVTGFFLIIGALAALAHPSHRSLLRSARPWIAAAACAAVVTPVVLWNDAHGWAGVLHRFVWTQGGFGLSLSGLGAAVGGQALYLGVPMAAGVVHALVWLWRRRHDAEHAVLLSFAAPALGCMLALCASSPAAEPHWPAQGYLTLTVALGGLCTRDEDRPRRLRAWTLAASIWLAVVLLVLHLAVWTPLLPVALSRRYEPRFDLTNELHGWPDVARAVLSARDPGEPVAGSHYTICSQLRFALDAAGAPADTRVLCLSSGMDDFDIWGDGSARGARSVLYVEDDRFGVPPGVALPGWRARALDRVELVRGGRVVRSFGLFRAIPVDQVRGQP
jgi:hypothetical protein